MKKLMIFILSFVFLIMPLDTSSLAMTNSLENISDEDNSIYIITSQFDSMLNDLRESNQIQDDRIGIYDYPIKPGMKEWANFHTTEDQILALQIPNQILQKMSTANLLVTVLNYPLLYTSIISYFNKDNPFRGIDHIETTFNGMNELLKRPDIATELLLKYCSMDVINTIQLFNTDPVKSYLELTQLEVVELLLAHKSVQSKLDDKEKIILDFDVVQKYQAKKVRPELFGNSLLAFKNAIQYNAEVVNIAVTPQYTYYVTTPRGTAVGAEVNAELDPGVIVLRDSEFKQRYPNATLISSSSSTYYCHSYAWYYQGKNQYWIPDPSAYMQDGSFSMITFSSLKAGNKVYYAPSVDHSAVVYSVPAYDLGEITFTSKWGSGPLMRHKANYGPYNIYTSSPTYWN